MAAQLTLYALADITPEWLTQILQQTGAITATEVGRFVVENMDGGFTGQHARLWMDFEPMDVTTPSSLVVKLTSADPAVRGFMKPLVMREVHFYQQLAELSSVLTPRCYYATMDSESGEGMLLLEDLGHCTFYSDVEGCSQIEALATLTRLAHFHAAWWEYPRLAELDWLPVHMANLEREAQVYQQMWPSFVKMFDEYVPELILTFGSTLYENAADLFPTLFSQIVSRPHTLQHGDFRLDNLAFKQTKEEVQVYVFDWQTLRRGRGAFDLARFILTSIRGEERRAWEADLLHAYYTVLVQDGIRDYSFQQCQTDFQVAIIQNSVQHVIAGVALKMTHPTGLAWQGSVGQRVADMIEDHHLQQLLIAVVDSVKGTTGGEEK